MTDRELDGIARAQFIEAIVRGLGVRPWFYHPALRTVMENIKIELAPPYNRDKETFAQRVTMSIEFANASVALKFVGDLQKLIVSYTPEAE